MSDYMGRQDSKFLSLIILMKGFVRSATVTQFLFECYWLNVSLLIIYAVFVVCSDLSLSKIHFYIILLSIIR